MPAAIAPAPAKAPPVDMATNGYSSQPAMPYTCLTCARRKVKCDKLVPACTTCRKHNIDCQYQAPAPRRRKRALSGDNSEKLARYERILHQHGLLPDDNSASPPTEESPQDPISFRFQEPESSRSGKLLARQGKSRYVDSNLWRHFGDEEVQQMYEDDEEEPQIDPALTAGGTPSDPLTGAFMGTQQSLLPYHPAHTDAMLLWKTHVENVEPICKSLHIPTVSEMVERVSQEPATASKADECLLFAIYHFAIFSMTESECQYAFGQSKTTLLQKYSFAARQALVNASFLKTSEMTILQSLALYLSSSRHSYDPQTYWILTGVAVRIAQRMGLHRDPEEMGLPPFDVQMRRRILFQILPLDGMASQMSGTGIAVLPHDWELQQPLNVNDEQIWPGMTKAEVPDDHNGATEMIFVLAKSCVGKYFVQASKNFKSNEEAEAAIAKAEAEVEEKYIRYCDIINPLHFLTIGFARSAVTAMRLRLRLPKVRNQTITDAERGGMWQLAQKIVDTDIAAYAHGGLRKYLWHVNAFFAWGSWDSFIFIVTSLRTRSDLLSIAERDTVWSKIEQIYKNHAEVLEAKRALQIALGRLTLRAWDVSPPSSIAAGAVEPAYITMLRSRRSERSDGSIPALSGLTDPTAPANGPLPSSDMDALLGGIPGGAGFDEGMGQDFNLDAADWMFWDQLIRDYQAQGGAQQGVPSS